MRMRGSGIQLSCVHQPAGSVRQRQRSVCSSARPGQASRCGIGCAGGILMVAWMEGSCHARGKSAYSKCR